MDNPLPPPFQSILDLPITDFVENLKKIYQNGEVEVENYDEEGEEKNDGREIARRNFWAYSFRSLLEVCILWI